MMPKLSDLPAGVVKVEDIDSIQDIAKECGVPVFTYEHQINPQLKAVWFLVLVDKQWFGYCQQ